MERWAKVSFSKSPAKLTPGWRAAKQPRQRTNIFRFSLKTVRINKALDLEIGSRSLLEYYNE
jgi:hypothetical protein